jgi:hypothetical protein
MTADSELFETDWIISSLREMIDTLQSATADELADSVLLPEILGMWGIVALIAKLSGEPTLRPPRIPPDILAAALDAPQIADSRLERSATRLAAIMHDHDPDKLRWAGQPTGHPPLEIAQDVDALVGYLEMFIASHVAKFR